MKRVRVLVANHPRLMRELVMATIADQPDIEVVGEVQNENDLADIVEQVQPDVLIIAMDHQSRSMLRLDLPENVLPGNVLPENNLPENNNQEAVTSALEGFKIQDGDKIRISPILPYSEQTVYLDGHVVHPGKHAYREGMRITDLIPSYTDLLPEPAPRHAEIIRLVPPDYAPQVIAFNLADALAGQGQGKVAGNESGELNTPNAQNVTLKPFERAFSITRFGLGRHVGKQDEYAAAFGGLNYIRFSPDGATQVEALQLDPGVLSALQSNLMLFFTGAAHHSWDILADQEESTRLPTGPAVEALHQVKEAAALMKEALLCGDLEHFGHLLDDAWQAKKRVSDRISNPRIDRLYEVACEHGVLGGKITGAGGGGFLLLYSEPGCQDAVRSAMHREGVQEMAFAFDGQGAQVIVNDPFIDHDEHAGTRWTFMPLSEAPVL